MTATDTDDHPANALETEDAIDSEEDSGIQSKSELTPTKSKSSNSSSPKRIMEEPQQHHVSFSNSMQIK